MTEEQRNHSAVVIQANYDFVEHDRDVLLALEIQQLSAPWRNTSISNEIYNRTVLNQWVEGCIRNNATIIQHASMWRYGEEEPHSSTVNSLSHTSHPL